MQLGVLTVPLYGMSLDEALGYLKAQGVQTVEIGGGGYPGKGHCNPAQLLADEARLKEFQDTFAKHEMGLCALSCHGNPIHPNKEIAKGYDDDLTDTILLAEKLGVKTIVTFSGCPGDHEGAKLPNWVTCAWPPDYLEVLDYQWNEVLIPYWKQKSEFAKAHGIEKIAFELHPGFCVYNTASMLRLREAVGPILGANVDPSHLFWQGMDPVKVIYELGDAIYHFHAKDTAVNPYQTPINGVLDTHDYGDLMNRSWVFRTVGYGHDEKTWRDIISALKTVGYDGAVSIEHEDALMSQKEGLEKAISFLKNVLIFENATDMWWA